MAITSTVYLYGLIFGLVGGEHKIFFDVHNVALMSPDYTPDAMFGTTFSDISANEMIDPTGSYQPGGTTVDMQSPGVLPDGTYVSVISDVEFTNITGDFRYAVVYRQPRDPSDGAALLMYWIDFGETLSYDNETLTLTFSNGFLQVKGV